MSDQRSNSDSEFSRFDPLPNTMGGADVGDVGDTSTTRGAGMPTEPGASPPPNLQPGGVQADAKDKAKDVVTNVQHKASEIGDQAASRADAGMDKAAQGLGSLASTLRERSESMGDSQMGSMATMAADRLESGAEMLRAKDTDQLVSDLEALVRRRPVESLLVAVGAGYLLSRAL